MTSSEFVLNVHEVPFNFSFTGWFRLIPKLWEGDNERRRLLMPKLKWSIIKPKMPEYSEELLSLNDEAVRVLIPAIVFISVLMFIGLIGNPLVIYFYGCKLKPTPSYVFIVTLAVFDLITCAVSMPLEMVDIVRFYTFESSEACKLLRFVNYFASIASGCTLIAIAVDRYRKICKPFDTQLSLRHCKFIIVLVIAISLLISWPSAVFFKVVEVNVTESPGLIGFDCTTVRDESYKIYITAYNIFLFLMFAISITVLLILYSLVGRQLCSLRSFRFYAQKSSKTVTFSKKLRPMSSTTNNTDDTGGFSSYCDSTTTATEIPIAFSECSEFDTHLPTIEETSRPSSGVSITFSNNKILPYDVVRDETRLSDSSVSSLRHCRSMGIDEAVREENMLSLVMRSNSANIEKLRAHREHLAVPRRNGSATSESSRPRSEMPRSHTITTAFVTGKHGKNSEESAVSAVETRDAKGTAELDQKKLQAQNINTRKYTIIMLSISIAFIISFVPYLALITWRTLSKDYEPNLFSESQLVAFQIGVRSFLLSSACNPLIYGFLNTEFQNFVLSVFCCCFECTKERNKKKSETSNSGMSKSNS